MDKACKRNWRFQVRATVVGRFTSEIRPQSTEDIIFSLVSKHTNPGMHIQRCHPNGMAQPCPGTLPSVPPPPFTFPFYSMIQSSFATVTGHPPPTRLFLLCSFLLSTYEGSQAEEEGKKTKKS